MTKTQANQKTINLKIDSPKEIQTEKKTIVYKDKTYSIKVITQYGHRRIEITTSDSTSKFKKCIFPMCVCSEFIKYLEHLDSEIQKRKLPENEKLLLDNTVTRISRMKTTGGREYRFDLVYFNKVKEVSIGYIFGTSHYKIFIHEPVIPYLIKVLVELKTAYPSLSPNEDYVFQPRVNASKSESSSTKVDAKSGSSKEGKTIEGIKDARQGRMIVLQTPAPSTLSAPTTPKVYKIEVVKGDKVFLRVSEFLSVKLKSSLHIPLELVKLLGNEIADYDRKIAESATKQVGK